MIRKFIFTLGICSCSILAFGQQENQFTQFMYNQLYLNPAYAGVRGIPTLTAIYRQQWTGYTGAPESKLISFNAPLFGDRVGFGMTIANNTLGIENKWDASMAYSYHVAINEESSVRFGLQGSLRYYGIDFSDPSVVLPSPGVIDQSITADKELTNYYANFGVGIYLNLKNTYFGVSVPHFFPNELGINPDVNSVPNIAQSFSHYYFMAGTMIPISNTIQFKPAVLAKYVNNAPFDLDVNLSLLFNEVFTAGLSYRLGGDGSGDSVDLLAMYQINSVAIGAAYDYSLSEVAESGSGSFEILLRYDFIKERSDMANPRFFF